MLAKCMYVCNNACAYICIILSIMINLPFLLNKLVKIENNQVMQIRRRERKEPCKTHRLLKDRDMGNQEIVKAD